jgi:hypothetical protein
MHKKYSKDGLVALSVALDNDKDKETRDAIDRFLRKQEATFTNLVSQGDPADWFKRLDIPSYPCVYVFNQDNRFVLKLTEEKVDYKVIEAEVVKLLKK